MQLACPLTIMYATMSDEYRKPGSKMWDHFVEQHCNGQAPGALTPHPLCSRTVQPAALAHAAGCESCFLTLVLAGAVATAPNQ